MSREQMDELNKKARDKRVEKKRRDQENKREEGTYNFLMKGLLIRTLCMLKLFSYIRLLQRRGYTLCRLKYTKWYTR
jgi:hypothetical protein